MTPAQQLNLKLRLERELRIPLSAFRKRVVKAFMREFGVNGRVLDTSVYDDELAAILAAHYDKVAKAFGPVITDRLPEGVAETTDERRATRLALQQFFAVTALTRAAGINRTTANNINDALKKAQEEQKRMALVRETKATATDLGAVIAVPIGGSTLETAAIAGAFLNRFFAAREEGIAITETQTAAESTKTTTVETLMGNYPSILGGDAKPTYVEKTWYTVQDDRVRDWHREAHGQKRRTDEPFEVGGELLRFPGDAGLGASAENIINCRCTADYNMVDIADARR